MATIVLLLAWLVATHDEYGSDVRMFAGLFVYGMIDELRGAPAAEDLQATAHFDEAGIAFDYPAVLRKRVENSEFGGRTWALEYGMFTLELYAPAYAKSSEEYLGMLADLLDVGGRSIDAVPPEPGRTATLCGEELVATRIRVKIMGDWSQMEGFDLPSPEGTARLLIFDGELVRGQPSRLAQATYDRVLGSLRCAPTGA